MDSDEIEFCQKIEPHEDDDSSTIKSKAVVKFASVQAPAKFSRLQCKTDLNLPPSNWLCNSANTYEIHQALHSSVGFASFNMAHMFSDCLEDVDVVSDAENIKKLLKLPYSPQSAISMMVHNIGNTLLIDEFDIQKYLLRKADDDDWNWLRQFIHEHILNRLGEKTRNVCLKDKSREAVHRKNLLSKFLYYTLQQSNIGSPLATDIVDEVTTTNSNRQLPLLGPMLPEPNIGENVPDPPNSSHVFNRNIVWTFEDIRMLIGTDMPIFGGGTRPCISLKLRDMKQPINVLTGIDYWLDNLMCNVPEVVMCYHLDGIVQKYELIKTEDLPHLENSTFSPQVIRNVAQNILAFLKSNATKAGHTYWLFKGKNDDVVKLYDLTTLCKNNNDENETATSTTTTTTTDSSDTTASNKVNMDSKNENPFTVPVAMLLYTVARNIKNTSAKISEKKAGSIKALLENCIKLLPKEKYPQIVTSSHYILSDLHIPADIDPKSPNFSDNSDIDSDTQSIYEDDYNFLQDDYENNVENSANDNNISSNFNLIDHLNENIAVKSICDTLKEFSEFDKNLVKRNNRPPSPLQASIEERCKIGLNHIKEGLSCLQYFNVNEEQITAEMIEREKKEEKRKIIHEEQHPNMAKPFQPIPLPYESLLKSSNTEIRNDDDKIENIKIKKINNNKNKIKRTNHNNNDESKKINYNLNEKHLIPTTTNQKTKIGSWNIHLKLLLIEKSCLIYSCLIEYNYLIENFGACLKAIHLALGCQEVVTKFMNSNLSQKCYLLSRAGDCLFQIVKHLSKVDEYKEQYEQFEYENEFLFEELEKDLDEDYCDIFKPKYSAQELMFSSCECYELALKASKNNESRSDIIRRLGSVQNELGLKYMYCAQEEYNKFVQNEMKNNTAEISESKHSNKLNNEKLPLKEPIYQILSKKSYDCLCRGIAAFEDVQDNVNLAFLLCNMGRFMRFRAHIHLTGEDPDDVRIQKRFYAQSFSYYQRALGILENRKLNPDLWDLVNWELSTATFTLAKQVQDFSKKFESTTEEVEKEIVELLQKSLKLCDIEHSGSRQILYTYRSGLIHNRLASFYHNQYRKLVTNTSDYHEDIFPTNLKNNLQLCRLHYEKSAKILESLKEVKEFLIVQLERIALQEFLNGACKNNNQKMKSLQGGLEICFQTKSIFMHICSNGLENLPIDEINKLLKLFENRLQFFLRTLMQLSMTVKGGGGKDPQKMANIYKLMFSASISTKSIDNEIEFSKHLLTVINQLIEIKNSN